MPKIDSNSFIIIYGWMCNELNLKDTELLVFAVIYGFSQKEGTYFTGSRNYLAEWCNKTLPAIDNALKGLLKKKLIIKILENVNGVTFVKYKQNFIGYKETLQGIKKLYTPCKETLHNNIDNNIDLINLYNNKDNTEKYIKELTELGINEKKLADRLSILRNYIKDKELTPNEEYNLRKFVLERKR